MALQKIGEILPLSKTPININRIMTETSTLTQFLLDPNSLNLDNEVRLHVDDPISREIFQISRDLCYAAHSERIKILKKLEEEKTN